MSFSLVAFCVVFPVDFLNNEGINAGRVRELPPSNWNRPMFIATIEKKPESDGLWLLQADEKQLLFLPGSFWRWHRLRRSSLGDRRPLPRRSGGQFQTPSPRHLCCVEVGLELAKCQPINKRAI